MHTKQPDAGGRGDVESNSDIGTHAPPTAGVLAHTRGGTWVEPAGVGGIKSSKGEARAAGVGAAVLSRVRRVASRGVAESVQIRTGVERSPMQAGLHRSDVFPPSLGEP
jgi:hypothetical protein